MSPIDPQAGTAVNAAACLDDPRTVRRVARRTARTLRQLAGRRRLSPITCSVYDDLADARAALAVLYPDPSPADLAALDRVHAFLDEHAGRCVLLTATCEVTRA